MKVTSALHLALYLRPGPARRHGRRRGWGSADVPQLLRKHRIYQVSAREKSQPEQHTRVAQSVRLHAIQVEELRDAVII